MMVTEFAPAFRDWLRPGQPRHGARAPKMTEPVKVCACGRAYLATESGRPTLICRECIRARKRKEAARSNAKALLERPIEERRKYARDHQREWRARNPRYKADPLGVWAAKLRTRFGLSVERYDALSAEQRGLCAICGRANTFGRRLAVDHCHATGDVRGLLCTRCNSAIGILGDTADGVSRAVEYLRRFECNARMRQS